MINPGLVGEQPTSPISSSSTSERPKRASFKPFHFASGEKIDELCIYYRTLGNPIHEPVLLLHGTLGQGKNMINMPGSYLTGPGQPLDASKHFLIFPDQIGCGRSSKPSDKLQGDFPSYDYR